MKKSELRKLIKEEIIRLKEDELFDGDDILNASENIIYHYEDGDDVFEDIISFLKAFKDKIDDDT